MSDDEGPLTPEEHLRRTVYWYGVPMERERSMQQLDALVAERDRLRAKLDAARTLILAVAPSVGVLCRCEEVDPVIRLELQHVERLFLARGWDATCP